MINGKIKALLKMYEKSNGDGAKALDIKYQSFSNKISYKGFNTDELIKLANMTGTKLAFIDENDKPIITFDIGDLKEDAQ